MKKRVHMMADYGIDAICGAETHYFDKVPVVKWLYVTCKRCLKHQPTPSVKQTKGRKA